MNVKRYLGLQQTAHVHIVNVFSLSISHHPNTSKPIPNTALLRMTPSVAARAPCSLSSFHMLSVTLPASHSLLVHTLSTDTLFHTYSPSHSTMQSIPTAFRDSNFNLMARYVVKAESRTISLRFPYGHISGHNTD